MAEHLTQQLGGMYHIYEPEPFSRGVKEALWRGMYGATKEKGLEDFVDRLPALAGKLAAFVRMMRFRLAPLDCEPRLRERIEAAVSQHMQRQPGLVGSFQDHGVRYRPRREAEEEPIVVRCLATGQILGLPRTLEV